jgi:hypothetical protein
MSDSDSDVDLRPHKQGRSYFGHSFFSDSDDEPEVRDYASDECARLPRPFAVTLGRVLTMIVTTPQQALMMPRPTGGHRIQGVATVIWPLKFPPISLPKNELIWATSRPREPVDPLQTISFTTKSVVCCPHPKPQKYRSRGHTHLFWVSSHPTLWRVTLNCVGCSQS